MLVSYKWLNEFVECEDYSPEEVGELITMAGVEVEGVEDLSEGLKNVVAGVITKAEPHPQNRRWMVCDVSIGKDSVRIVSGAPYLEVGKGVIVALPGAQLPNGSTVEVVDLKGVESQGNLVSEIELGLAEEGEVETVIFLEDLEGEVKPGDDVTSLLYMDDKILEVSPTPNRPDCLGVLGVAREVSAILKRPLRLPDATCEEMDTPASDFVKVKIMEPPLCPRYTARYVEGVTVAPSPLWMKVRVKAAGMRPINNLVDVTNYVLMELGHPLHAFDYDDLEEHTIVVRRARQGEIIVTLDGVDRELDRDTLLIADASRGVAIAGIMGGANSEVRRRSERILVESAFFNPTSIRRTSKRLGLQTEASYRFERGMDIEGLVLALNRTTHLIQKVAGGISAKGFVDEYPLPYQPKQLALRQETVKRVLGISLSEEEMEETLNRLGFNAKRQNGSIEAEVPPFRAHDVTREIDLVEEVARIHGFHKIPSETLRGALPEKPIPTTKELKEGLKDLLWACGLKEVITYSFISPKWLRDLGLDADDPRLDTVELLNPLTEDMSVMRTTILPGILQIAAKNQRSKIMDGAVFEVGRVFRKKGSVTLQEPLSLACLMMGRTPDHWSVKGREYDLYDIKGVAERVWRWLFGSLPKVVECQEPFLHPGRSLEFREKGVSQVAVVGELHPKVREAFGLKGRVYVMEMSLPDSRVSGSKGFTFTPPPKFPATVRDLSIVVKKGVSHGELLSLLKKTVSELVEEIRLIDRYQGPPLEEGEVSLTYSFRYRAPDRTLTDEEVESLHQTLAEKIVSQIGAKIRGK